MSKAKTNHVTTPALWSKEVTLSVDPLAGAVDGDNLVVGWSSGGDILGFRLNPFGSFVGGNLIAGLSGATATPLSGPHFLEQGDGSLIVEYKATPADTNNDALWHILNTTDPLNVTPIAASAADEILNDATATLTGSAIVYEFSQGGRTFQNLKFVAADGASDGVILVGVHAGQSQLSPSIVGLANGNVAIAYENFTPGAPGTPGEHDIRLHVFTPGGADVADAGGGSHEVMVGGAGQVARQPDMALTNNGSPGSDVDDTLVVAWQDNKGIEFRRFTNERGLPLDTAHTVAGAEDGVAPHVAALNDGGFILEWGQTFGFESDGSRDFDIVLQRFDRNGDAVGDRVFIDDPGDQGPFDVSLATFEDGRVIVTFANETGDSTDLTRLDYVILDPRDRTINGTADADTIVGRQAGSVINGRGGNDHLAGMKARDTLSGGRGADTLSGGFGKDTLLGGAGADAFQFGSIRESKVKSADVIMDFHHAQGDLIDLSKIDARTGIDGTQAFRFIGTHDFHHKAGELRFVRDHGNGFVAGDVDGDGRADFRIDLPHVTHLAKDDFILLQA